MIQLGGTSLSDNDMNLRKIVITVFFFVLFFLPVIESYIRM